jgi:hypothetical protein
MKKQITCPVCEGSGHVAWINKTEDTCSIGSKICPHCDGTGVREVAFTNADRIRAMTDEELARFIPDWSYTNACKCDSKSYVDCNNECEKCVAEWLKLEAWV